MFEQRAVQKTRKREPWSAAGFALPDAIATGRGYILDIAEREPDLPGRNTSLDRLFRRAPADGIQNHVVREYATIRPELVGHRNPELTQTHDSTVTVCPGTRRRGAHQKTTNAPTIAGRGVLCLCCAC